MIASRRQTVVAINNEEWLESLQSQIKQKPSKNSKEQVGNQQVGIETPVAQGRRRVKQLTQDEYNKALEDQIQQKKQRAEQEKEDCRRQDIQVLPSTAPNNESSSKLEPLKDVDAPRAGRRRAPVLSRDEWLQSIKEQNQQKTSSHPQSPVPDKERVKPRMTREEWIKSLEDRIDNPEISQKSPPKVSTIEQLADAPTACPEVPHEDLVPNPSLDAQIVIQDDPHIDIPADTPQELPSVELSQSLSPPELVMDDTPECTVEKSPIQKKQTKGAKKTAAKTKKKLPELKGKRSSKPTIEAKSRQLPAQDVSSTKMTQLKSTAEVEGIVQAYKEIKAQNEEMKKQLMEQGQVLLAIQQTILKPAPTPQEIVLDTKKSTSKIRQSKLVPPGRISMTLSTKPPKSIHLPLVPKSSSTQAFVALASEVLPDKAISSTVPEGKHCNIPESDINPKKTELVVAEMNDHQATSLDSRLHDKCQGKKKEKEVLVQITPKQSLNPVPRMSMPEEELDGTSCTLPLLVTTRRKTETSRPEELPSTSMAVLQESSKMVLIAKKR